jgi:transposase InsO family protein
MDASFCVEALNDTLARYATPEIFNTDQGSQFTSFDFTGSPTPAGRDKQDFGSMIRHRNTP